VAVVKRADSILFGEMFDFDYDVVHDSVYCLLVVRERKRFVQNVSNALF